MAVESQTPKTSAADLLGQSHVSARADLKITRQVFFGETSYVIRDPVTYEGHRLSPFDYEIFTSLHDEKPLSEIFEDLKAKGAAEPEQEEDFYRFVVEIQKRGLLSLPVTDADLLFQKYERKQKARSKNLLMKLLFLKVPLGSPDRFLSNTYHYVSWMFTRTFFALWLIGLCFSIGLIAVQWSEFTSDLASALALQNLPVMILVLSLLKLWHELGHGYACRHFDVAVPNSGLLFMVGTPLAFVDASGSWALKNQRDRQIINLAGIYFEMLIAIAAAIVWTFSADAQLKSIAHFTLLLSSITTVAFNINPLMKYDGYFVLTDLLGIPNLKSRSTVRVQSLTKRVFFGISADSHDPPTLNAILVFYGIASALYKVALVIGIAVLIATSIWVVGLAIAGYYLVVSLGGSLWKAAKYLCCSPEIEKQRTLAWAYLIFLLLGGIGLLAICPVPGGVCARGVVQHEDVITVHSPHRGFLKQAGPAVGTLVEDQETLIQVENIDDLTEWRRLAADLQRLKLKHRAYQGTDPERLAQVSHDIARVKYELKTSPTKSEITPVVAPHSGRILNCKFTRTHGSFVEKGDEICKIGEGPFHVDAVLNAKSIADIKPTVGQRVQCRFLADSKHAYPGTIKKISISGSRKVRHESLTHLAGGPIPVDAKTKIATEAFFDLTIELNDSAASKFLKQGMVCDIRFGRERQTIGRLLYQSILRFANKVHLK